MLKSSAEIFAKDEKEIGILGQYIPKRTSVHLGLYWIYEQKKGFVHFSGSHRIEVETQTAADKYHGTPITGFNVEDIPSVISLSGLIKKEAFVDLKLDFQSVIYQGNKFDITTGKYIVKEKFENQINCSVFVIALLETYRYSLIAWDTWPTVNTSTRSKDLEDWLDLMKIPVNQRDSYYNLNKEIRGKHVIAAPFCVDRPVKYDAAKVTSEKVIDYFKTTQTL